VPAIVRWPGRVKAGAVSDHVWAFWDFLPTACELAGAPVPPGLDGLSLVPILTGKREQEPHDFLYWEFHEGGFKQAVRHGDWKAIRLAPREPLELYNVVRDPAERVNVAKEEPRVVATIEKYLKRARTESREFPIREPKKR
jgi:arylsulfatase A-like enzyme